VERHALTPLEAKALEPSEPAAGSSSGTGAATAPVEEPRATAEVQEALVAQARERRLARPPQRWAELDDKRVLNTSAMLERRNLLTRMLAHLAFRKVGFDERHVRTIRDQARDADLVYVMNHHSLLDYLYFNYVFLRVGLPLVYFANKISMVPFRPLFRMALYGLRRLFRYFRHRLEPTERLAYGLERGRPALIYLKTRTLWPWAPEKLDNTFLEALLESQRERIAAAGPDERPRPIHVIPQLLVWTLNPDRYRKSFWTTVFGNPEAPGRLRKLINFLLNRRRAFVQVGKPIDLVEFLAANGDQGDVGELARSLRYTIHQGLSIEERVIRGPVLKRARRLREEILDSARVKAAIGALARESGSSEKALSKEIGGYLKEMAADFSMTYVEFMCMAMTVIFSRLYSEMVIDRDGLERVREAGRKAPLILLPCHRSHVDYLVISYTFYANGLIAPHIAAGKNLNFFPVGKLFRRSGAFFIRRSFKDNPRYGMAFREYIRKLVKEGYWIEFFLEGGRSRTGKMLPPKFGMLKIIVDAIRAGAAKDVYLVPIYVGYEQVIEEGAFTRELRGGAKKKENITALLNATQVLWSKYGRLYVNFAEPISCREALDRVGLADDDEDPKAATAFLHTLGYRVSHGINSVAMVTPSSLAASALLFHPKRGAAFSHILRRVGFLLELAHLKGARLSKTLEHSLKIHRQDIVAAKEELNASGLAGELLALGEHSPVAYARGQAVGDAIAEALGNWQKNKLVQSHVFGEDDVVWAVDPAHRINLDFYKNNIVHLLVPEAIMATAVRSTMEMGTTTVARVMEGAAFLSRTFQYEFVFDPDRGFATAFRETLAWFEDGGLIRRTPGEDFSDVRIAITERGADTMALFHRVLLPWVEAYWLLAMTLDRHADEPVTETALVKDAQTIGERRYQVGDITCTEASSSVSFQHALDAYAEFGFLTRARKGREKLITCTPAEDGEGPFADLAERLKTYVV
jgi:glycerol-3-phosphate O-acyltransferase